MKEILMEIVIKKEKLANRCDICHQRDKFNAKKNYCKRCYKHIPKRTTNTNIEINSLDILFIILKVFVFITVSSFLGLVAAIGGMVLSIGLLIFLGVTGLSENRFIDDNVAIIVFLPIGLAFIFGLIEGIKITTNYFSKPIIAVDNLDSNFISSDDQPYWVNSKNIYA